MHWLTPGVKRYEIGGITPLIGVIEQQVDHIKGFVRRNSHFFQFEVKITFLFIVGIKVYNTDHKIAFIIGPFVIRQNLVVVRRDEFNIGISVG